MQLANPSSSENTFSHVSHPHLYEWAISFLFAVSNTFIQLSQSYTLLHFYQAILSAGTSPPYKGAFPKSPTQCFDIIFYLASLAASLLKSILIM